MWLDESQPNQPNIFLPDIKLIQQSSMQCREIQLVVKVARLNAEFQK